MRIFSIFFHPCRKVTFLGGAEKRFLNFLKFLCNEGYDVKVLVLEAEPRLIFNKCRNIRSIIVKSPFKVGSKSLVLDYFGWILWSLKVAIVSIPVFLREKPNLILAPNNTLPNVFPAVLIRFLFRKPLCVVVHHFDITSREASEKNLFLTKFFGEYRRVGYSVKAALLKALASKLAILLLRKADLFISVSKFTTSILERFGVEKRKILVSGNGVDFEKISSLPNYAGKKVFDGVFVGRISLEKGIYDLLYAWKIVTFNRGKARLAVIGEGSELENLKAKIKNLGLEENVTVFGGLSDEEMYRILLKSKIFVFPSFFEGWGLAVAEALACGLPVICYEIPALKEIFGKYKNVFFVPKNDHKTLAKEIIRVLEGKTEKFSGISRDFVKSFDWKIVFEKDLEFLWLNCKKFGFK